MHPANLVHIQGSYSDLIKLVNSKEGLVVVDFFATWCGPCVRLGQELPNIANEFPTVTFVKAETEKNEESATRFGVRSIPNIVFMKGNGGNEVEILGKVSGFDPSGIRNLCNKHK